MSKFPTILQFAIIILVLNNAPKAYAQPATTPRRPSTPHVTSPEVSNDRRITFRLFATNAESVRLNSSDLTISREAREFSKGTNGIWQVTVGPVESGAYRYSFNVDGLTVIDPRNPLTSEAQNNTFSLIYVPGSEFQDTKNVPHGAVAEVTYFSSTLNQFRRMHVYTPPGYEKGNVDYPVFYLLHGASDSDDSWTTVGRANFIIDNLIAAKKAKPMIVVMPAGHTRRAAFRPATPGQRAPDEFVEDFVKDIMPYIEKTYRVSTRREDRALAGLSMGGAQTLNVAIPRLDKFGYLGVFSSGVFGITGARRGDGTTNTPSGPTWAEQNAEALNNAKWKEGLKLFWFGTGKDDFLVETSRATVEMFKKHQFNVVYDETAGAHTWFVWRDYLNGFAPKLFK